MRSRASRLFFAFAVLATLVPRADAAALNRLLLANCQIITLAEGEEDPFTGYIVVDADGRIAAIGHGNPPPEIDAKIVFDAMGQVAMPGFVSARSQFTPDRSVGAAKTGDLKAETLRGARELLRGGVTFAASARAKLESDELAALREAGIHVEGSVVADATIWNPLADGRLKRPLVDAPGLMKRGALVGMAIDGGTGADVADPFENMRVGLYAIRFRDADPRGLQPLDMLRLHTIASARAAGVADRVGTLAVGKLGDIILIDPHWPDTGPIIDLYATLVLACDRLNITNVFVAGTPIKHTSAPDKADSPRYVSQKTASATTAAETPRLVVANALLVPLDWSERAPFRGYLVVSQSGRIAAIGAGDAPKLDAPVFDAAGRIVMPGFLSGHNHLSQSVTRGRAAGSWVTEWGRAGAAGGTRTPRAGDTYAAVLHGSADMVLGGITTFYNYASMGRNYESLTETLDGMLDSGGRFVFGTTLPRWSEEFSREELMQFMRDFLAHAKTVPDHERALKVSISSMAMRWGEEASRFEFEVLKAFPEMQLDMQMHYLEPPPNVPRTYYERSNFPWLAKYGILGHNLTFAHFIHPTEEILTQSAAAKVCMIWNPLSNGRLGSGLSDIRRYRALGITCGMGIDGQASADITDPFQNMRVGLYGQRFLHPGEDVFTPREMLHFHTIETARAIRVEKDTGSLEVGKFADFIVIDPGQPGALAGDGVYAALVFACSRANISDVFVAGRAVIRDRKFLPFDLKQFQTNTRYNMQRPAPAVAVAKGGG